MQPIEKKKEKEARLYRLSPTVHPPSCQSIEVISISMLFYFFFFLSLSLAHHKRLGKKGKTNKTTQIKKAKGNFPQLSRAGVSQK
jgi:hypothetical protein